MKYYITTPIYYATAKPHLGSLYSTVLADICARWHKMQGYQTFFLTGTDEHGQKIAAAAEKLNLSPKELLDKSVPEYKKVWQKFEINYNKFIRTTDNQHKATVQKWLKNLLDKNLIYKNIYEGWYCTPCETFVKDAPKDVQNIKCSSCERDTQFLQEEAYFFRLSLFQDKLLNFYKQNPGFIIPPERFQEVINFVESGLKDLCISRASVSWGIPFPDDEKQTVYVWADALSNYITAIGYLNPDNANDFNLWWPADIQVMGKDIVRFHAVYWLAFLMALDLPLPKNLLVHGWIKVDNQKMSKSLGNVVDPEVLFKNYGPEAVRYYLASHIAINHDSEFSIEGLESTINSDLVNGLGNLLNRSNSLAFSNNITFLKSDNYNLEIKADVDKIIDSLINYWKKYQLHLVISDIKKIIDLANRYFHNSEPWKLAKQDPEKFKEVLVTTFNILRVTAHLLSPILPKKMSELLAVLGIEFYQGTDLIKYLKDWSHDFVLTKSAPLFTKIEVKEMQEKEVKEIKEEYLDIKDFAKVKIAVGKILECKVVEGSDKLVIMQVDCGEFGTRQILSGVRPFIMPEDLVDKHALFVVNLKPRKVMGHESQGMMLSAASIKNDSRTLARIVLADDVKVGSLIG